jgi:acetyltransferase-like isoleucine patch superfamily enzyme
MIPGLPSAVETQLKAHLGSGVSDLSADWYEGREYFIFSGEDTEARALGVVHLGGPELTVVATDATTTVGEISVQTGGAGNLLFLDNAGWTGRVDARMRLRGHDNAVILNSIGAGYAGLAEVFLRGNRQFLFWGRGATAVACSIELEGDGRGAVIGDDALISNGVWIRNHDMHALHDLATGGRLGRDPVDTVIERHVWLGQDLLLLGCERIGMGSVLGARALVKGRVPRCVIAAGVPARVIRERASWGRERSGMTEAERASLGLPRPRPK